MQPPADGSPAIVSGRVPTRSRCGRGAGAPSWASAVSAVIHSWTSPDRASSSSVPNTWNVTTIRQLRPATRAGHDPPAQHGSPPHHDRQRSSLSHHRHRRTGLTGRRGHRQVREKHPPRNNRTRRSRRDPRPQRLRWVAGRAVVVHGDNSCEEAGLSPGSGSEFFLTRV